jgi:anhydro-N-acetylmuramic acid kinase
MENVIAFDTGPGNMVIDGCAQELLGKSYDANGSVARRGQVIEAALTKALAHPFFRRKPPKSAGRGEFGREFVAQFLRWCGTRAKKNDVLATATALTAVSIGRAVQQGLAVSGIENSLARESAEYVVSGGGVNNLTLMRLVSQQVQPLGFHVVTSDDLGMPSQAKEAVAFALLAYQTWHRHPGNVPSATGAKHPVTLGKISFP